MVEFFSAEMELSVCKAKYRQRTALVRKNQVSWADLQVSQLDGGGRLGDNVGRLT